MLAVAALAKARDFAAFRQTVDALTPWRSGDSLVAAGVIGAEGALAALLAAGVLESAVAAATLVLFLCFAGISLWAVRSGIHVHCNCFGRSDRELGRDSLRSSLLLAGATLVYLAALQGSDSIALREVPLALGLGVGAVLAGRWLLAAGQLAAIVRQRRGLERDLAQPARLPARGAAQ